MKFLGDGVYTDVNVQVLITCTECGNDISLWMDSMLAVCMFCGFHAFKKEAVIN